MSASGPVCEAVVTTYQVGAVTAVVEVKGMAAKRRFSVRHVLDGVLMEAAILSPNAIVQQTIDRLVTQLSKETETPWRLERVTLVESPGTWDEPLEGGSRE